MAWQWSLAIFAVWLALSLAYVRKLRAILGRRESTVIADLDALAARTGNWTAVLSAASHRDWRRSAEGLQPVVETLSRSVSLETRVAAAGQVRSFLEQAARWATQDPAAFPADIHGATEEVRHALDRVQASLDEYRAAAGDAAFADRRFPLSVIAGIGAK